MRDFAALSASWADGGRTHAGIVHLVSSSFPHNRSYVGVVVTALDAALRSGEVPGAG